VVLACADRRRGKEIVEIMSVVFVCPALDGLEHTFVHFVPRVPSRWMVEYGHDIV
jgi:hypothetical protein